MPGLLPHDVLAFAPELASKLSDAAWVDILAYVNEIDLTQSPVGETAQTNRMAQIYLAAHMGTMTWRANTGAAGPVTSEAVGGVRRSYGFIAMTGNSALSLTRYGLLYQELLASSLAHGPFVL